MTIRPNDDLAAFASNLSEDDIPPEARRRATDAITDCIACSLGGSRTDLARHLLNVVGNATGDGQRGAVFIASNHRGSVYDAALYNGAIAHAHTGYGSTALGELLAQHQRRLDSRMRCGAGRKRFQRQAIIGEYLELRLRGPKCTRVDTSALVEGAGESESARKRILRRSHAFTCEKRSEHAVRGDEAYREIGDGNAGLHRRRRHQGRTTRW